MEQGITFETELRRLCEKYGLQDFSAKSVAGQSYSSLSEDEFMGINIRQTIEYLKDVILFSRNNFDTFLWFDYLTRQAVVFLRKTGFEVTYYPQHKQWFVSWEQKKEKK